MNLQEIYQLVVKLAIENDLRGKKVVEKNLKRINDKFDKLSKEKKANFDKDKLTNPYSDSRILYESKTKKEIKKIMVGVDMEVPMFRSVLNVVIRTPIVTHIRI